MTYYQALDTFIAESEDGTQRLVTKGEPLIESHELVKRDLAAVKANPGRAPLFRALDDGEPPAPKRSLRGSVK